MKTFSDLKNLFVVALLAIAGCATDLKNEQLAVKFAKPELKVGIAPDFPPLIFKQNGKINGIEFQFAERIGKILGVKIVFVERDWGKLIPSLNKNEFDVIMSGMTVTPERSKLVKFTTPYKRVGQMAIMRTSDIAEFSTVEKVLQTKKRAGFLAGTTGEAFVRKNCPNAIMIPCKTVEDAEGSLINDKMDVFIADAPVIWVLSSTDLTPLCVPLTEEYLAWALRPGDADLAEILNECLDIMKKDSYLNEVESAWIPELIRNEIYNH